MNSGLIYWSLKAARSTGRWGIAYVIFDGLVLAATFAFTLAITAYFGHDTSGGYGPWLATQLGLHPEIFYASVASVAAFTGLMARLGQTAVEARIIVVKELQFASDLRRTRPKDLAPGVMTRASSHFGRLAAASVKILSAVLVLAGSLLVLLILTRGAWRVVAIAAIVGCVLLAYAAFRVLAGFIAGASTDMALYARGTSLWKTGTSRDLAPVRAYSTAYFRRIFLPNVFTVAPLIFASVMSLVLVFLAFVEFSIDLSSAFIAFIMAQAYLSIVGRAFNNAMSIAAFVPAVVRVSAPGRSDVAMGSNANFDDFVE